MITVYAARDKKTGILVNDITTPPRRFWEREVYCRRAVEKYQETGARFDPKARTCVTQKAAPEYELEVVRLKCMLPEELKR